MFTENLWFVFQNEQLLLTLQMEIPTNTHPFIQNGHFFRQLPLDRTLASPIIAELNPQVILPSDLQWIGLKQLYNLLPSSIMALAGRARQLLEWDQTHQFCGICGAQTLAASHEHSRICMNPQCKKVFYPKISPVIIVAIERDEEILLARSPHFPTEIYSVLAGFVEAGESVEEAVHREVYEETQLKITNLRYFGSQPWPFPNSLMLGFQADYESGKIVCADGEIEHAAFFSVATLPKTFPGNVTMSKQLLNDFCRRHQKV